ncbi:hypothetical protein INT45_007840 [Circinella minor]|uniref:Uncharacterized protein n=1 Tax=Circinella minor TaxID=1195481 RepID=A0A8H7RZG5_9FUNG|nr:hypothetical protein INT45_007840 [Circinella minor]
MSNSSVNPTINYSETAVSESLKAIYTMTKMYESQENDYFVVPPTPEQRFLQHCKYAHGGWINVGYDRKSLSNEMEDASNNCQTQEYQWNRTGFIGACISRARQDIRHCVLDYAGLLDDPVDIKKFIRYENDVALIGTWDTIPLLLQACEDHSKELGYQWNPNKCIYMSATDPLPTQLPQLYHINIQRATTFTYLGVPFNQHGCINNAALIDHNTTATVSAMNILASIGVRARCLGKLLSTRLYRQFIRPKMEYGLAITKFTHEDCKILQESQNTCLQKIYGTKTNQSMAVIHHLANLEYMTDRVTTLQAKFILRSYNMPDDALFPTLLPRLRAWNTFVRNNTIWKSITATTTTEDSIATITTKDIKNATKQHLKTTYTQRCQRKNSKLLNQCRKQLGIDPILWLPMTPRNVFYASFIDLAGSTITINNPVLIVTKPPDYQNNIYSLATTPEQYTTPSPPINNFGQPLLQWIEPPTTPSAPSINS